MTNTIRRFAHPDELARSAAEDVISILNKKSGERAIGLCGGRSVSLFYHYWSAQFHRMKHPEQIHFFLVDERLAEDERNAEQIRQEFLDPLLQDNFISEDQIHFKVTADTLESAGKELNENLSSIRPSLAFDLLILGVGEDAHIAGLFPNHTVLETGEKGYGTLSDSPKEPSRRMTLLPESIRSSHAAFLFFVGPSKKEAFEQVMSSSENNPSLPATFALTLPEVKIYQTDGEN